MLAYYDCEKSLRHACHQYSHNLRINFFLYKTRLFFEQACIVFFLNIFVVHAGLTRECESRSARATTRLSFIASRSPASPWRLRPSATGSPRASRFPLSETLPKGGRFRDWFFFLHCHLFSSHLRP